VRVLCDTREMTAELQPRRRAVRRDALVNREKILRAAAESMAQQGLNVPLADIAKAAGVGVGTFYRGFPDRTALLHALEHRSYDMLIDILDRIEESGQTGADAIETYLLESLNLGHQLVLPLRGAPPLTSAPAVAARRRINASLERFLADGRIAGTVHTDVNATDIIICAAMTGQPLPHGPAWPTLGRRHLSLFVRGLRSPDEQPLPGPPVTRDDLETQFAANAD